MTKIKLKNNYWLLIGSILLCQTAGIIGSIFTVSAIKNWYVYLNKPSFSPPNWLFGPAWLLLYTLMGISLYLIRQKDINKKAVRSAVNLFIVHLFFNAIWSIVFFGMRNPFFALLNIVILWLMIVLIIFQFWKIKKVAAYLLVPYLFWVSFATILNFFIWKLN